MMPRYYNYKIKINYKPKMKKSPKTLTKIKIYKLNLIQNTTAAQNAIFFK